MQAFGRDLRQLFEDFEDINPAALSDAMGAGPAASTADAADQQVRGMCFILFENASASLSDVLGASPAATTRTSRCAAACLAIASASPAASASLSDALGARLAATTADAAGQQACHIRCLFLHQLLLLLQYQNNRAIYTAIDLFRALCPQPMMVTSRLAGVARCCRCETSRWRCR